MNHKLSSADLSTRNPKIHRQANIPSISRSRTFTTGGLRETNTGGLDHLTADTGRAGPFSTFKKTAHHVLSKAPEISPLRPRFASTPARHQSRRASTPILVDKVCRSNLIHVARRENGGEKLAGTLDCMTERRAETVATNHAHSSVTPMATFNGHLKGSTLPASARKPDPRLILSSLKSVLGTEHDMDKYLDAHDLLAIHQLNQVDFEDRGRMRENWSQHIRLCNAGQKPALRPAVLGEPLRKASIYSTTSMVLGGREHDLPIIVVNTVEELYRTGIYQENLFRTLPNRARLLELIEIYDSQEHASQEHASLRPQATSMYITGFGADAPLHLESTADICALLTTYLTSLTEPILPPMFFRPIWEWCGLAEEDTWYTPLGDSFGPRLSHLPMARTYTSPVESNHILVAQLLLHLLPSPNFSLLVYLLAFFSQVALVHQENGVDVSDLSKMFGRRLFGGEITPNSSDKDHDAEQTTQVMDGETMMSWFLYRWASLSEGLFEVVEDAKLGLFHRPLVRCDSFGKDILASWPLGIEDKRTSVDLAFSDERLLSTPKDNETGIQSPKLSEHDKDKDYDPTLSTSLDDTWGLTDICKRPSNVSFSSTAALDERLLDAMSPTLLNQTLPVIDSESRSYTHRETQTISLNPVELVDALQYTSYLESQLEERTCTLKNTLAELMQSKIDASKLRQRVHTLEIELDQLSDVK